MTKSEHKELSELLNCGAYKAAAEFCAQSKFRDDPVALVCLGTLVENALCRDTSLDSVSVEACYLTAATKQYPPAFHYLAEFYRTGGKDTPANEYLSTYFRNMFADTGFRIPGDSIDPWLSH